MGSEYEDVQIGSVWRENDKRFTRYVQVVSLGESKHPYTRTTEPHAEITVCGENGVSAYAGAPAPARTTKARLSRFGRDYKLVSPPLPAAAALYPPRDEKDIDAATGCADDQGNFAKNVEGERG